MLIKGAGVGLTAMRRNSLANGTGGLKTAGVASIEWALDREEEL